MRVGREGALLLFSKWAAEGTLLGCSFESDLFAAAFRGRIRELTDVTLRLVSDDGVSELALALLPELDFWYGEDRDSEVREFLGAVFFSRPAPPDVVDRDVMCIRELPES